jgi:hypothetical protein
LNKLKIIDDKQNKQAPGKYFHILNPLRSFPNLLPDFSRPISLAFSRCCLTSIIICLPTGDISEEDAGEGVVTTGGPNIS